MRIAIAGKGGSGKTTFSSLLIYHLRKNGKTPILAVDADPNTNLHEALGMTLGETVADLRDDLLDEKVPQGMAKHDYINLKLQEALAEGEGLDLLVMGRPEGRGCYCFVNDVLRQYIHKIGEDYASVVMDNEAGMEHLSRRTTDNVDVLFLVSEPSLLGLRSAARVKETAGHVKLNIGAIYLVVSKTSGDKFTDVQNEVIKKGELELIGVVPKDDIINEYREKEKSLLDLPNNSIAVEAVEKIMKKAGII